jgi:hypothetical protein
MEETNLISFPSYFLRGTTSLLYNAGKISGFATTALWHSVFDEQRRVDSWLTFGNTKFADAVRKRDLPPEDRVRVLADR